LLAGSCPAEGEAQTFTVTLDKQGGTGGTSSVKAILGSPMPSINKPTRFGHIFEGYYTETEGDEEQYFNADEKSARDYNIAPNTTLYAFWQKARFTVSFDLNYEGSGSPPAARTAAGGGGQSRFPPSPGEWAMIS
jgi:hypothetical protein